MSDCVECKLQNCNSTPSIAIYSLQDRLFFNGVALTVVVTCPPGRTCTPGKYPRTITYPPGTFSFPDPGPCNGFPIVLGVQGCRSYIQRTLDCSASQAEIDAAANEVIQAMAEQQGICDSEEENPDPPSPPYLNRQVYYEFECDEGYGPEYAGTLPYYLSIDLDTNRIILQAGMFAGTTQSAANAIAQAYLNNFVAEAVSAGDLTCEPNCVIDNSSPLTSGEVGVAYSETLTASVIPGTLEWSIVSGALPNGLSLDSATGEISGTPISEETASFTAQVSNGTISCQKAFELEITMTPVAVCPDWALIPWDNYSNTDAPGIIGGSAVSTITPVSTPSSSFTASASAVGGSILPSVAISTNSSSFNFVGDNCNCNLALNIVATGAAVAAIGFIVRVYQNAVLLFQEDYNYDGSGSLVNGANSINFSVNATGIAQPINVQVEVGAVSAPGNPGRSIAVTGQFTNV